MSDPAPISFGYRPPVQKSLEERAEEAKKFLFETPLEEKIAKIQEQRALSEAQSRVNAERERVYPHGNPLIPAGGRLPPEVVASISRVNVEPEGRTPKIVIERTREGLIHFAQWRGQRLEEATVNFLDRYMQKTFENLLDGSPITPLVLETSAMDPKLARDYCALWPDEKQVILQQLKEIPVKYHQKTTGKLSDAQAEQLLNDSSFGIIVKENGRKKIMDAQPMAYTLAEQIVTYIYDPLREEQKLWGKLDKDAKYCDISKGKKYAQDAWKTYNDKTTFVIALADLSPELQAETNKLDKERDLTVFLYHLLKIIGITWLQLTELQVAEAVQRGWMVSFEVS